MSNEDIISIANSLKLKYSMNNSFIICKELKFSVDYMTINLT